MLLFQVWKTAAISIEKRDSGHHEQPAHCLIPQQGFVQKQPSEQRRKNGATELDCRLDRMSTVSPIQSFYCLIISRRAKNHRGMTSLVLYFVEQGKDENVV